MGSGARAKISVIAAAEPVARSKYEYNRKSSIFGALLGKRLDVVGGLVLISLGTKILIEHLRAP